MSNRLGGTTQIVLLLVVVVGSLCPLLIQGWNFQDSFAPGRVTTRTQKSLRMSSSPNETVDTDVKVLGVCGGIGSGKSMACKLLVSDLGCVAHIDTDSLAHQVYKPGSQAVKDVVQEFGQDILVEGKEKEEIDRKKLGRIVFSERSAMAKLEEIVWPHVKVMIQDRIEEIKGDILKKKKIDDEDDAQMVKQKNNNMKIIVLEAAVLLDAGWDDLMDGVWVIRAPKEVAMERLIQYRGFSESDAEQRIVAQESRQGIGRIDKEINEGRVTAVIENKASEDELKQSLQETMIQSSAWKIASL